MQGSFNTNTNLFDIYIQRIGQLFIAELFKKSLFNNCTFSVIQF